MYYNPSHSLVRNTDGFPSSVSLFIARDISADDISLVFTGGYGYDWYAAPSLV